MYRDWLGGESRQNLLIINAAGGLLCSIGVGVQESTRTVYSE